MNRYIPWLLVLCVLAPLSLGLQKTNSGDDIQVVSLAAPKCQWRLVATLADPNVSFGVDDRLFTDICTVSSSGTYTEATGSDADPNWVVWKVPADARTVTFTSLMDADGDDAIVEIWVAANETISQEGSTASWGADSFAYGTTITWKAGTQAGPNSKVYSDTATTTSADGVLVTDNEDSTTNRIVTTTLNIEGYQWIAFLGTTVDTNCYILARWSN
jgi:hypothetical protein